VQWFTDATVPLRASSAAHRRIASRFALRLRHKKQALSPVIGERAFYSRKAT